MAGNRIKKAEKNFVSSTVYNVVNLLTTFVLRTFFIYYLGIEYLGINGLFANILGMLSLAELGVSSAAAFSMYKPLANGDKKKIRLLVDFYKKAYRMIAVIIFLLGVLLIPFLQFIVNGAEGVSNIYVIYGIFLINTVLTYLISYKTILITADQREFVINNVYTVTKVLTTALQIFILVVYKNYILFLIIDLVFLILSRLYINYLADKMYPFLKEEATGRLSQSDRKGIFEKVKALFLHKIGEVSIYQTDNILTSIFISTDAVGLVSNFTLIISNVNKFIVSFFNSALAGLGNVIAVDTVDKQVSVSNRYDFISYCFYSWSSICLYFLLRPFITLWLGSDRLIDYGTVCLLCINFYMTGMRVAITNVRNAAGIFEKDKWVSIIQAIVNIVASIIFAISFGLPGIYMGTFVSSLIPGIVRPYKVYKYVFKRSPKKYFQEYLKRAGILIIAVIILEVMYSKMSFSSLVLEIAIKLVMSSVVIVLLIVGFYFKKDEFKFFKGLILSKIKRGKNGRK